MFPMPSPTLSAASTHLAAKGHRSGLLRRLGQTLSLLTALLAVPSIGLAQDLPSGTTSDDLVAPGETSASQWGGADQFQGAADASAVPVADGYTDTDPSALTEFEQPLTPYGDWVDDPTYGTVWVPSAVVVGPDFAPYQTGGHWALTDDGDWIWTSDYAWGHIPFHYGRWVWISAHGWSWIPGRVYAPAWVVWRVGDAGYVGWAPMPPAFYWSRGVAVTLWTAPPAAFVFCPTGYVFHDHVHTYIVQDRSLVRRIAGRSHTYRPARPTAAASPGRPQSRREGAGASHAVQAARPGIYRPASPSLTEVGIPASSAPKFRTAPDARSLAYARRSTTPTARTMSIPARTFNASPPSPRAARAPAFDRQPSAIDAGAPPRPQAPAVPSPRFRGRESVAPSAAPNETHLNSHHRLAPPLAAPRPRPSPESAPSPALPPVPRPTPPPQVFPQARPTPQPRVSAPMVRPSPTPTFVAPMRSQPSAPAPMAPRRVPATRGR